MSSKSRFLIGIFGLIVLIVIVRANYPSPPEPEPEVPTIEFAEKASEESKDAEATLERAIEIARASLATLDANLVDYRGRILKQERVDGELQPENEMQFKIRTANDGKDPRSMAVYLKFLRPDEAEGREVIWVADKNDGQILGHEGGWKGLLTLKLDPLGKIAMWGNRYPVTEIGFQKLIEQLLVRGQQIQESGGAVVEMIDGYQVGDRSCLLIRVKPHRMQMGKLPDGTVFEFSLAEIALDQERSIPLYYAAYGIPESTGGTPPLLESYQYLDVEINVGLEEKDFDPENPEYQFP